MNEIETALAIIDAHLKAHPNSAALEQWRQLREQIIVLDEQRYVYLTMGVALGILLAIVIGVVGSTHP